MIQNTKGKLAEKAVTGKFGKGFPNDLVKRTQAMLTALDAAVTVDDLRFPPGNHLEELKITLFAGRDNYKCRSLQICFTWTPVGPSNVEIVDYH